MNMNASVLSPLAEPGWKNYDDFSRGIDINRLPSTRHWAGKTLDLALNDGSILQLNFHAAAVHHRLTWRWGGEEGEAQIDEVCVSKNRYFFSFPLSALQSLALVMNTTTARALVVRCSILPAAEAQGGSRLSQQFYTGAVATQTPSGFEPQLTRELIGYRTLNIYSPHHYYEHFYVNSQRYAWQNLRGEQFGHGDMDYATYYKFEPDMYLFTFREKIIPVCSVFFFDYQACRCTGIFMGITAAGEVQIRPAGAIISKMSFNCYPAGVVPF
ncbi:MAG TPA: hypothetical protein DD850_14420 [Erwinia persicina]|uniref:MoaF N-terminal domain-containing protein n=2 Tax=Erwinia persicina TaxID=55211 RepID=A0A3S7S852_9GAMM|nr:hypothetical protein CI789_17785 [Erwinia persicina]MBC3948035.1 MoaF N-terminal domain-containing protein [Erwinia persicina]MBD8108452.1 MoaF N-terminal domain-containing protein [Erwinia persicina]MBD8169922.1 MoaF N-terminal domain-containing protein [Erwinia persicina]MBD8211532.1 MoaF N-terminal domain-containing protein [Erwinia persicina]